MRCPHCDEQITHIRACQQVTQIQEIKLVDDQPFAQHGYTIEFPRGKPGIKFRCGHCGGDLADHHRECTGLLKRGSKR